uniref:Uncharacterized protein n=1 Tax=Sphaerodactylus townsendi TaxID=933632 RepID=A0ACB8FCZ3_9SAUR
MKHLENEIKAQCHNRSLNKNAIGPASADTHPTLASVDSPINEVVGKYKTILVTTEDKITKIMLNRLDKKNAINLVMYEEIMQALDKASKDDCTLTVITGGIVVVVVGRGDYFSSGNDFNSFAENVDEIMKDGGKLLAHECGKERRASWRQFQLVK